MGGLADQLHGRGIPRLGQGEDRGRIAWGMSTIREDGAWPTFARPARQTRACTPDLHAVATATAAAGPDPAIDRKVTDLATRPVRAMDDPASHHEAAAQARTQGQVREGVGPSPGLRRWPRPTRPCWRRPRSPLGSHRSAPRPIGRVAGHANRYWARSRSRPDPDPVALARRSRPRRDADPVALPPLPTAARHPGRTAGSLTVANRLGGRRGWKPSSGMPSTAATEVLVPPMSTASTSGLVGTQRLPAQVGEYARM